MSRKDLKSGALDVATRSSEGSLTDLNLKSIVTAIRPQVPALMQYPPEILAKILSYLEPCWLLQAITASEEIDKFMTSDLGNQIFFNALPAAIWMEPEHFQDMQEVHERLSAIAGSIKEVTLEEVQNVEKYKVCADHTGADKILDRARSSTWAMKTDRLPVEMTCHAAT